MQDHHLQGHAHGVGQAVDHHADRIPDQQQVAGVVERGGDGRGIGRQADDGLAALARSDVGGGQATDRLFTMGGQGDPSLAAFFGRRLWAGSRRTAT
jgi:hypothetical protein